MSNFIQLERFSSINFFLSPTWNGWNAVVVLSVLLAIVWAALYVYHLQQGRHKQQFLVKAWWLMLIFWLPLAWAAVFSFASFWSVTAKAVDHSLSARQQARLCQIDENQKLGGVICQIYPTIEAVKAKIGRGVSLCYLTNSLALPFLQYGLYDWYGSSADCQTADYLFLYLPQENISYNNGHILRIVDKNSPPVDLGGFEAPETLDKGIFLLKRTK